MKSAQKASVSLKLKHHRMTRWFHWIHFPVLAALLWSGFLIYWANDVYQIRVGDVSLFKFFPEEFYRILHLDHRLAEGMAWHFLLQWLFVINGVGYVAYTFLSGEWRFLVPRRSSFREAWDVILHDLGLAQVELPQQKFNGAQKLAYTGILFCGAISVLTGYVMYKPVQLAWLGRFFGGYEWARWLHFWLAWTYVGFFIIHMIQVSRAGWNHFRSMVMGYELEVDAIKNEKREKVENVKKVGNLISTQQRAQKMFWKSFFLGGLVFIAGAAVAVWIRHQPEEDGISRVLRTSLEWNAQLWSKFFSPNRLVITPQVPPVGTVPRLNGQIGLNKPIDIKKWRLLVYTEETLARSLNWESIRWIPRTYSTTQFFCIEGWSTQFSYAGIRFSDFMKSLGLSELFRYVGLETPDGKYYVSVDMESMLHPQTLLADEMNEKPLTSEHGAPLRLIIPIKYGIKSLKRIGTLRFSNTRPPDYWAERGYDWYAGL